MAIAPGGTTYSNPVECWTCTMTLAYIDVGEGGLVKKALHQLWQSNLGRTMWRPIIEISRYVAETGNA